MAPAPAPASRDARARARRDDREFDGLNEAIRRSMEEVGAPAPAPPAPRDEGTLEPRVDGDWEATARKLLREIKDEQARNPGSGNGQVNLEGLRPTLTRCGFSGTPPPWRRATSPSPRRRIFPKKDLETRFARSQLVNYLEGALGEDEDEEDEEEDDEANNEDDGRGADRAACSQPPQTAAARALVLPRAMDLATLSEGHLREEAKRRKLGPLPSDGKPELLALLRGEVSPGADFLPRLIRTDWRPGEWCLGVWDHDWTRTADGIPETWYGLVVKANADGTLVVAFTDDDDQFDVRPGELRALDRSLTGCSKGVRWARARLEEHGTATADALGRLVEPPRRGGASAPTGRRAPAPAPRPAGRQPRRAAAPAAAPALTTREPDANGLRFYDANAVRTPNNRALEELKIDELWDKWHRQLKITNQGVVHGHGTVAKVRLYEGHTIVDPTAIYMEGPPPVADQDGGARSERFLYINERNHLKIGSYAGEPRGAWALSYFVNEARDGEPNARRTIERALPGTCSGLRLLRDVHPGEEIRVVYVDESYDEERERIRAERGERRWRCVYHPVTAGGGWRTCVGINGKSTNAGTYETQEEAARAVDALLLAHDQPAVNYPGEEAATRAAFPRFFAHSDSDDDAAVEPDAADEPAPAGSDTDDGPPPAPEDESDSDASDADAAARIRAELVAFLPANADFLANIAPFAAARASSLAEFAALPADALHEVFDAAGWKMLKANALRRALARYRDEHAAPATDDADEDAGDDADDAPPPAPAAAAPGARARRAGAAAPAAPAPPAAPAAAPAPSPEPVAAPAAPEPVAAPSREELRHRRWHVLARAVVRRGARARRDRGAGRAPGRRRRGPGQGRSGEGQGRSGSQGQGRSGEGRGGGQGQGRSGKQRGAPRENRGAGKGGGGGEDERENRGRATRRRRYAPPSASHAWALAR